jgi:hypothetical protein
MQSSALMSDRKTLIHEMSVVVDGEVPVPPLSTHTHAQRKWPLFVSRTRPESVGQHETRPSYGIDMQVSARGSAESRVSCSCSCTVHSDNPIAGVRYRYMP